VVEPRPEIGEIWSRLYFGEQVVLGWDTTLGSGGREWYSQTDDALRQLAESAGLRLVCDGGADAEFGRTSWRLLSPAECDRLLELNRAPGDRHPESGRASATAEESKQPSLRLRLKRFAALAAYRDAVERAEQQQASGHRWRARRAQREADRLRSRLQALGGQVPPDIQPAERITTFLSPSDGDGDDSAARPE
jgi:hypothetical protein